MCYVLGAGGSHSPTKPFLFSPLSLSFHSPCAPRTAGRLDRRTFAIPLSSSTASCSCLGGSAFHIAFQLGSEGSGTGAQPDCGSPLRLPACYSEMSGFVVWCFPTLFTNDYILWTLPWKAAAEQPSVCLLPLPAPTSFTAPLPGDVVLDEGPTFHCSLQLRWPCLSSGALVSSCLPCNTPGTAQPSPQSIQELAHYPFPSSTFTPALPPSTCSSSEVTVLLSSYSPRLNPSHLQTHRPYLLPGVSSHLQVHPSPSPLSHCLSCHCCCGLCLVSLPQIPCHLNPWFPLLLGLLLWNPGCSLSIPFSRTCNGSLLLMDSSPNPFNLMSHYDTPQP